MRFIHPTLSFCVFCLLVTETVAVDSSVAVVESTFEQDLEGWTTYGDGFLLRRYPSTPVEDSSEKEIHLTCQPRVFSPVGNAFSLTTAISFELIKPANATVKVYNVGGQLVQWIARNQALNPGKQVLNWDGRNHRGEIVPTGLYIVTVTIGTLTETKVVNVFNH